MCSILRGEVPGRPEFQGEMPDSWELENVVTASLTL